MEKPLLLVCPDSFKGTFSASQVASALAEGIRSGGCEADICPVADGGEGTTEVLGAVLDLARHPVTVSGPFGEPRAASFAMAGEEAFLDLAEASGIAGLAQHQLDPVRATTFGTGELILAARRAGARRIVVAAGGSATVDGGRGAFEAIERGGGLGDARLTVLCDVEVPFERAAEIFGPQKGATPEVVDQLSNRLAALAESWPLDPRGLPMGGAAGGFSGGCWAAYDARLVAGAGFVLDRLGFESRLRRANAVVAGEGRLDEQSFMGKILGAVASRSARADRPIHTVCGQVALREDQAMRFGLATSHEARTLAAIGDAGREIAEQLAAAM